MKKISNFFNRIQSAFNKGAQRAENKPGPEALTRDDVSISNADLTLTDKAGAVIYGAVNGAVDGFHGLVNSPHEETYKHIGMDKEPKTSQEKIIHTVMKAAVPLGIIATFPVGSPVLTILSALAAPGIAGAFYEGVRGGGRKAKERIGTTKKYSIKAKEKVSEKMGKTAGQAAMYAAAAGVGVATIPLGAATGFVKSGLDFAKRLTLKTKKTFQKKGKVKKKVSGLRKLGENILKVAFPAALVVLPDFLVVGATLAVGGGAALYTGLREGSNNAVKGYKAGHRLFTRKRRKYREAMKKKEIEQSIKADVAANKHDEKAGEGKPEN